MEKGDNISLSLSPRDIADPSVAPRRTAKRDRRVGIERYIDLTERMAGQRGRMVTRRVRSGFHRASPCRRNPGVLSIAERLGGHGS